MKASSASDWTDLQSALAGCMLNGVTRLASGTLLVSNTPHYARNSYLHYLFAASTSEEIQSYEQRAGVWRVKSHKSFLKTFCGLSLFHTNLHLFGLRRNRERSGESEEITAVCLYDSWDIAEQLGVLGTGNSWRGVGAASAQSAFLIELHSTGTARIGFNDFFGIWPDLRTCLLDLVEVYSENFTCDGVVDDTYDALERAVIALVERRSCS